MEFFNNFYPMVEIANHNQRPKEASVTYVFRKNMSQGHIKID